MTDADKEDTQSEGAIELLSFVSYRISLLHPKLNAQAAHILGKLAGISLVQWRIISLIDAFGPKISSSEIITRVSMDKGLFSRALKKLVEDERVISMTDPSDQRRMLLSLSPQGKALQETVIQTMRERQKHLMHDLTADERNALYSAFAKLERNADRRDF